MNIIYFQPRVEAVRNYRTGDGAEQIWCPWWALLLQQHAAEYVDRADLVDARLDEEWRAKISSLVQPGTVFAASVMTGAAIKDAIEASELAQSMGAIVIWGGTHPTLFPEEVSAQPFVDVVIQGFGAVSFGAVIRDIKSNGMPARHTIHDGKGQASGVPVMLARRPASGLSDVSLPSVPFFPAIELVRDWSRYRNEDQAIGGRVVNMITSEGCLRRCTFCSEPTTSAHSWLVYDISQCVDVASKIISIADADGLKLHDPNLLQDTKRSLAFGKLFHERVGMPWAATVHPADLISIPEEVISDLARYGLRRVLVGLEGADQGIVNLAGKRYSVDKIPQIADKLARNNVAGMFTFIVGWPGFGDEHYQRTIDTAFSIRERASIHQAKIHFLEPWPGTPIHKLMQRNLSLPDLSLQEWAGIDYYFAHHPQLHNKNWESRIRAANEELSPYVEA